MCCVKFAFVINVSKTQHGVEILTSQLMWSFVAEPLIVLSKTTLARYFIFIS